MHALRCSCAISLFGGVLAASLGVAQENEKLPTPPPQNASAEEFSKYAMKLREQMISKIEPRTSVPTTARSKAWGAYQWREDIVTTTFWVGSAGKKGVGNDASCWDPKWAVHFGGFDNPDPETRLRDIDPDPRTPEKAEYRPRSFEPKLNPFYFALPYNDVTRNTTKPEARACVPWFQTAFVAEGQSVLRDRWIAVRNRWNGRIAYAQWSDCGPACADDWQYVFGQERPKPNAEGGAGLSVSPSVRDYLNMAETDVNDWRFVEAREVPPGPWRRYGENNPFVQQAHVNAKPDAKMPAPTAAPPQPTVQPSR